MARKIFGIGLDGATFDLVDPWIKRGELPVLASLLAQGARGKLKSTVPPMSPQAWSSFVTGKNPGKHGIYDFVQYVPNSYEIYFCNAATRKAKSLWRILSDSGKTVGAINVPMCYPPEPVNGFIISGMEAPGVQSEFTYPPDLYKEMKKAIGEYDMHGDSWTRMGPEAYIGNVMKTIDSQSNAIKYLMKRFDCDLFFAVFGSTDRVQHFFWKYLDPTHPRHDPAEAAKYGDCALQVYRKIDAHLGELLQMIPKDATVFVMSDHGAGPFHKIVYLDKWLKQQGYLKYKDSAEGSSIRKVAFDASKNLYIFFRKFLPRGMKDLLKSALPETRRKIESHLMMSPIDWENTKAFYLGIESTRIFINLKGRFPRGTVEPGAEYERLRDEIIARLMQIKDPDTGQPVVEHAYKGEEIYWGNALPDAPDILVLWKDDLYITRKSYGVEANGNPDAIIDDNLRFGEIGKLMSIEQTGTHRPHGIFCIKGEGIEKAKTLSGAEIIDLAPTLLYLLDLPVPSDMDGNVLEGAITSEYLATHPIKRVEVEGDSGPGRGDSVYSGEEFDKVEERLRSLGYIE
ncbi:MAG: alkaline phosphatase family protein [Candidatus Lindowbacteria bacterium]|nr:alkaline phosphatase family protein [Candidatus Lindowbacteria bacterium]